MVRAAVGEVRDEEAREGAVAVGGVVLLLRRPVLWNEKSVKCGAAWQAMQLPVRVER